jgi:hypothetical protein
MVAYRIKVNVTESRKVEITLPDEFPLGEADVTVAVEYKPTAIASDREFQELTSLNPKTGEDIVKNPAVGSWADLGIEDSVEFVKDVRQREESRQQW